MKKASVKTSLWYNNRYYNQGETIEFEDKDLNSLSLYLDNITDTQEPNSEPKQPTGEPNDKSPEGGNGDDGKGEDSKGEDGKKGKGKKS